MRERSVTAIGLVALIGLSGCAAMQDRRCRCTLQVLDNELSFLKLGGYGRPFRSEWRPTLIFRDSPTCLNFESGAPHQPCERCPLFEFIPEDRRKTLMPCHQIPLDSEGATVASLYQHGTQQQLDKAVRNWLEAAIEKLQREENNHERS